MKEKALTGPNFCVFSGSRRISGVTVSVLLFKHRIKQSGKWKSDLLPVDSVKELETVNESSI